MAITLVLPVPHVLQAQTPATAAAGPAALRGAQVALPLDANDFVVLKLDSGTHPLAVHLYGPDGNLLRRYPAAAPGELELPFVTTQSGTHRLAASTEDGTTPGDLAWTVAHRLPQAPHAPTATAATTASETPPESPRLRQLHATLAQGASTAGFWEELARTGTPLVEDTAAPATASGKTQERLVTFLWRGQPQTRGVTLLWSMRGAAPNTLQRLGQSDVWYLSLRLPQGMHAAYQLAPDAPEWPAASNPDRFQRYLASSAVAQADPLNPRRWPTLPAGGTPAADRYAQQSVLAFADAPGEPWLQGALSADQRGQVQHQSLTSKVLGNDRIVSVYTPPGYAARSGSTLPVLVLFDREAYLNRVDVPRMMDGLIRDQHIPPTVVVLVANPNRASRGTELPPNPAFADFLAQELMPWVRARWKVSPHARDVALAGSSYGGLASAWVAYRHPQVFGNVIALSGSFWWAPTNVRFTREYDRWGEGEWLSQQYATSPRLPVRFFLAAGLFEFGTTGDGGGILETSRHLRDVLRAKDYAVHYQEFAGGHDYLAWRGQLAQGLKQVWGLR